MNALRRLAHRALLLPPALALCSAAALGAPFEIAVSPSRFELTARSADRVGQSLELHNLGADATEIAVRTLDWRYSDDGQISYHDELLPGSCRPWVTLERRTVRVPARGSRKLRFQIDAPADAARGECRFMIALEGVEPAQQTVIQSGGASLSLPVSGRIAVAVYVMLNGAQPRLTLHEVSMQRSGGKPAPRVRVSNEGDAHGRLEGALEATDAQGQAFNLVVEGTPILPGQTRTLALVPRAEDEQAPPPQPSYPVKVQGLLDWDQGSFRINTELR
ncbi:hypothetical protein PGB34_14935 [Xenophilus arseniciresistens]|uniref:Molecular chaperone n=1 Tax=Xenophilus arseniciresistens TaxID=1283306 RepID=A0AAE3NB54_9BURK|nr:hypothetical protein [Xenophilus arseniciresistens]MDA7417656.1 hypothetical protein [Xenophilus arseniciresistens]